MNSCKSKLKDVYLDGDNLVIIAERKIPLEKTAPEFIKDILRYKNEKEMVYLKDDTVEYVETFVSMDEQDVTFSKEVTSTRTRCSNNKIE